MVIATKKIPLHVKFIKQGEKMQSKMFFMRILLLVLSIVFIITNSYADINQGLILHFQFEENSEDASGNGNNGTSYGIQYQDGVVGKSAFFDGIDDYILIKQSNTLNNLQTMSLSYWIKYYKPTSGTNNVSVVIANGPDRPTPLIDGFYTYCEHYGISHKLGKWGDNTNASVTAPLDAKIALSEQQFHFITFIVDEYTIKIYRNAKFIEENERNSKLISRSEFDWFLGKNGDVPEKYAYYLNGNIDELRVYNRVISQSEILDLYYQYECAVNDHDQDGVPDDWDLCSDTPINSSVFSNGCSNIYTNCSQEEINEAIQEATINLVNIDGTKVSDGTKVLFTENELSIAVSEALSGTYSQKNVNEIVEHILSWGDTDGDGRVGLKEAIKALIITSGVKSDNK